jgi:hypothetical protein
LTCLSNWARVLEDPEVDIMLKKRISGSHRWEETNAVSPNICDDKQRFAKYLWKKLPEIFDDKSDITLNTAELLPNMCDNHHVPCSAIPVSDNTTILWALRMVDKRWAMTSVVRLK